MKIIISKTQQTFIATTLCFMFTLSCATNQENVSRPASSQTAQMRADAIKEYLEDLGSIHPCDASKNDAECVAYYKILSSNLDISISNTEEYVRCFPQGPKQPHDSLQCPTAQDKTKALLGAFDMNCFQTEPHKCIKEMRKQKQAVDALKTWHLNDRKFVSQNQDQPTDTKEEQDTSA